MTQSSRHAHYAMHSEHHHFRMICSSFPIQCNLGSNRVLLQLANNVEASCLEERTTITISDLVCRKHG